MPISCKRCLTEIPQTSKRNIILCPECGTVQSLDQHPQLESILPQLTPKGITPHISDNALTITRRWFSQKYIFITFFAIFWNVFLFFFASNVGVWIYLFCPHGWIGLGLIYYVLAGYLNSTEMHITPNYLTVQHGPLPHWGNKQFNTKQIEQLYVRENIHRSKNSTSYTYALWMKPVAGNDEKLIEGMDRPEHAFFLEQEIERFLGIVDEYMPNEYSVPVAHRSINWNAWETVAVTHHLDFSQGKLLEGTRVVGQYRGYEIGMVAFQQNKQPYTRIILVQNLVSESRPLLIQPLPDFLKSFQDKVKHASKLEIDPQGQKLTYEQRQVETNPSRLQSQLDALVDWLDTYPAIVALGGEAIPILRPIAAKKEHLLNLIAHQLLQEIAPTTLHLQDHTANLWCRRCLTYCTEHAIELSLLQELVYYGCRTCHQSHEFFSVQRVTAILDQDRVTEPDYQNDCLRVNWLIRQNLFDFHEVEIIRVDDEMVERFAVQVGNDTDPKRRPRYQKMVCTLSAACHLSPNTRRILERTFGLIKVV